MNEEDQRIFNNALKIATSEMSSEGKLIYWDLKGALQDTENHCFSISLNELVRFYFALKQEFEK